MSIVLHVFLLHRCLLFYFYYTLCILCISYLYSPDAYCLTCISITQICIVLFLVHRSLLSYFYYTEVYCLITITLIYIVLFLLHISLLSYIYYTNVYCLISIRNVSACIVTFLLH